MDKKNILEEIYKIDKDMKKHEKELEQMIQTFIEQKPDIKIDQHFVSQLRARIMSEEEQGATETQSEKSFIFTVPRLSFALAGAALTFLLMLPFINFQFSGDEKVMSQNDSEKTGKIARLADQAFGSLVNTGNNDQFASDESIEEGGPASVMSNGDGATKAMGVVGRGGGGAMDAEARMIAPYYENIVYKYVGDEIDLGESEQDVYKRIDSGSLSSSFNQLISNVGGDLIDASKFTNVQIESLNIAEDKEFGLMLSLNNQEGSININRNWTKWPNPTKDCRTDQCFQDARIKMDQVPSDNELIAVSDSFISQYGIDVSNYGEPEVNDEWRLRYETMIDNSEFYIPEGMQVIYPLIIDGEKAYNEDGRPNGLNIEVNIRYMKVSGAYSLRNSNFQSSKYQIETDTARVLKLAENGGNGSVFYRDDANVNTLEVELGTPERILVMNYQYQREKGTSNELFIPALRFPILEQPEGARYFNREYVVVPIVKEILDERLEQVDRMPVEPMPMPVDGDFRIMEDELEADEQKSNESSSSGSAAEESTQLPPLPPRGDSGVEAESSIMIEE